MRSTIETFSGSKHFRLRQAAEGVFAAISVPGTGSLGNAAIVDLGDATLIVDTLLTIEAAQDLRAAAEHLTGRRVTYVFNTHYHADHTFGNQVFAPTAQIISTSKTREIMETQVKERITGQQTDPEALYRAIEEFEEKAKQEGNEKLRQEMVWECKSDREYAKMLPDLTVTLPTLTFDEEMWIHGSQRSVQLITYGGGHTQSDAFLYIPDEKIAVMGDLVLSGHHPVMSFGDPNQWLQILERVEALDIEKIVPGHGAICSIQGLHEVRRYIDTMFALAEDIVQHKTDIDSIPVPEDYQGWYFTFDFKSNLHVLRELLSKSEA